MGYTHYWDTKNIKIEGNIFSKSFVKNAIAVIKEVMKTCDIEYFDETSEEYTLLTAPSQIILSNGIAFNGNGDLGHESFVLDFEKTEFTFNFCKTNRKPYDIAVCAVLILAKLDQSNLYVSTDGEPEDWEDAFCLVKRLRKDLVLEDKQKQLLKSKCNFLFSN